MQTIPTHTTHPHCYSYPTNSPINEALDSQSSDFTNKICLSSYEHTNDEHYLENLLQFINAPSETEFLISMNQTKEVVLTKEGDTICFIERNYPNVLGSPSTNNGLTLHELTFYELPSYALQIALIQFLSNETINNNNAIQCKYLYELCQQLNLGDENTKKAASLLLQPILNRIDHFDFSLINFNFFDEEVRITFTLFCDFLSKHFTGNAISFKKIESTGVDYPDSLIINSIFDLINANNNLTSLRFQQCTIFDSQVIQLSELIENNTTLLELHLDGCFPYGIRCTDDKENCLALAFKNNKSLSVVNLEGNAISASFAINLLQNRSISTLKIAVDTFSQYQWKSILNVLNENFVLTSLSLSKSLCSKHQIGADTVIQSRQEECLKYIQNNKDMFSKSFFNLHQIKWSTITRDVPADIFPIIYHQLYTLHKQELMGSDAFDEYLNIAENIMKDSRYFLYLNNPGGGYYDEEIRNLDKWHTLFLRDKETKGMRDILRCCYENQHINNPNLIIISTLAKLDPEEFSIDNGLNAEKVLDAMMTLLERDQ